MIADLQKAETFPAAVDGTRRMLDVAIRAGVQRFVHCSTGGVHGHIENPPADEEGPFNAGDSYQRTKLEGKKVAMDYFPRAGCVAWPSAQPWSTVPATLEI